MATAGAQRCDGATLLTRLNALFTEDPCIDELGLLFGIDPDELSVETAFVLEAHKLGVAFSAGALIFRAARTHFHVLNRELHADAGSLPDATREELLKCTRAIVLISADFYTAWNTRKEFVSRGWLLAADEVMFTNLVFSLHPKSIDTWAYRRWLATRLCAELEGEELDTFFTAQIALCTMLTERYARNYHAWSFRHWIVSKFSREQLELELLAMQSWCETHITDHSGWNHRQHTVKCLLRVLSERTNNHVGLAHKKDVVLTEYEFLSTILAKYPSHEALWCHRRFVMQLLLKEVFGVGVQISGDDTGSFLHLQVEGFLRLVHRADPKSECEEEHCLGAQWKHIRTTLSSTDTGNNVAFGAMLLDVEIAWKCSDRFARRYSLWLLERLVSCLEGAEMPQLEDALARLATSLRASLSTSDTTLDCLWLARK